MAQKINGITVKEFWALFDALKDWESKQKQRHPKYKPLQHWAALDFQTK